MSTIPKKLASWIERRLEIYEEKSRKGIARGQPHGIPRHKYHAALLHLVNQGTLGLREIAKETEVSYGLLLKWRTEDRFRQLIRKAGAEYSSSVASEAIYGDNVVLDTETYERFVTEEMLDYSPNVVGKIVEELGAFTGQYREKVKLSGRTQTKALAVLTKIKVFMQVLMGVVADYSEIDESKRAELRKQVDENVAQFTLSYLEHVRKEFDLVVKKGEIHRAQELFDKVYRLAEQEIRRTTRLRKEFIEEMIELGIPFP